MKEFGQKNTPYVKASVVVWVEGMTSIVLTAVARLTGRQIRALYLS